MHEYTLYSQIPAPRHTQVQQILAGISASQPVAIAEEVFIYKQLREEKAAPGTVNKAKGTQAQSRSQSQNQNQRLSYLKLVRNCSPPYNDNIDGSQTHWRRRDEGTPDPASKTIISRTSKEQDLSAAQLEKFLNAVKNGADYESVRRYLAKGSRFVHENIIVTLTRIYVAPDSAAEPKTPATPQDPLLGDGGKEEMTLLDPSGTWLLEATVRTEDQVGGAGGGGTDGKASLRERAVKELEKLRSQLEGSVGLVVPERLSMATWVK